MQDAAQGEKLCIDLLLMDFQSVTYLCVPIVLDTVDLINT